MLKTVTNRTSPDASFLTYRYNDIFAVATAMVKAIDPARLRDPGKPVTVSVRGDYNSGKKIFPDAAAKFFFGNWGKEGGMAGNYNWDEYYRDPKKEFEIDFINIAWGRQYGCIKLTKEAIFEMSPESCVSTPDDEFALINAETLEKFKAQRQFGGISYIHNYDAFAQAADIDIVIRQAVPKEAENLRPGLTAAFRRFSNSQVLSRFVSLNVNDATLLSHPRFAKFVDRMNAQMQDAMCMYRKNQPRPQNA